MPFAVCVTLTLRLEHRDEFMPLMLENAHTSLSDEPGCHQFDILLDADRPDEVFLYEIYSNSGAFQDHLDTEHFQRFDQATQHMLKGKVVKTYAQVVR